MTPMPPATDPKRYAYPLLGLAALGLLGWGLVQAFRPQPLPLQGQIEAQEFNVSSKVPGRVGRVAVRLGQTVQIGELLFELDSPEVRARLTQARSAQTAAQAVAAKTRAGARPEEVEMARLAWERAQTGARIARLTYERVQAMADEGVIARQKRDEAQAQWRAAEEQAQAARAQYELARKGARIEDRQAAQAQAEQVGGVVAEAEVALAETRILAPTAGEVAKVQIQPGELAPQGYPVITLVNLQDVWAVLQLREDAMAAYAAGSRHTAQVPALQRAVEFSVSSVAVLPDFATWRAARPGGTDLRTFEIRLRPLAAVPGLRPGMGVVFPAP
jgi:HlyD family secretion protein